MSYRAIAIVVAFWVVGIAGGPAGAQSVGGVDLRELFQQLDSNRDSTIQKEEVPDSALPSFEQLLTDYDTNKDGKIDRKEFGEMVGELRGNPRGPKPEPKEAFKGLDQNGDEHISKEEYKARIRRGKLFGLYNTDGNKFISEAEALKQLSAEARIRGQRFDELDKDGDGRVSKQEFRGPVRFFERLDVDKDGYVTPSESENILGDARALAGRFKQADANGDGKLSRDEFNAHEDLFERLETFEDGFLTKKDAARYEGSARVAAFLEQRFKASDKDGDGKLSPAEYFGSRAAFDRLDADKNGSLSIEELEAGGIGSGPPPSDKQAAAGPVETKPGASKDEDGKSSR